MWWMKNSEEYSIKSNVCSLYPVWSRGWSVTVVINSNIQSKLYLYYLSALLWHLPNFVFVFHFYFASFLLHMCNNHNIVFLLISRWIWCCNLLSGPPFCSKATETCVYLHLRNIYLLKIRAKVFLNKLKGKSSLLILKIVNVLWHFIMCSIK